MLAFVTAGCATTGELVWRSPAEVQADVHDDDLVDLREFTVTDLQAALVTATHGNDLAAMTCYPALIKVVQRVNTIRQAPPVGLVDTFERVRLVVRPMAARDDTVDVACAALRTQIEKDLVRFNIMVGKIVASGGVAGGPAALKAAPKLLRLLRALRNNR